MPRAGQLRHRVTIRAPGAPVPDGYGGHTPGPPTEVATVWAAVEPLEGTERLRAMQTQADATHRVRMRYRPGLTAAMDVVHRGRVLEVVSPPINVDERDRELVLLCREGT